MLPDNIYLDAKPFGGKNPDIRRNLQLNSVSIYTKFWTVSFILLYTSALRTLPGGVTNGKQLPPPDMYGLARFLIAVF